jgi:hypothetical protein
MPGMTGASSVIIAYFKEQAELFYTKAAAEMKKSSPGRFFNQ